MKSVVVLLACFVFYFSSAQEARASAKGKIIARDALIGGAVGIVTGLLVGGVPAWFLIGAISGGLYGYIESDGSAVSSLNENPRFFARQDFRHNTTVAGGSFRVQRGSQ